MSASSSGFVFHQEGFEKLVDQVVKTLRPGESLFLSFSAESSDFLRINGADAQARGEARVLRQGGRVIDGTLSLSLVVEAAGGLKKASASETLTGDARLDEARAMALLEGLRHEMPGLPVDPFAQLPKAGQSSVSRREGKLLSAEDSVEALIEPARGLDLSGMYASGKIIRAMANSAGLRHWFETETFSFDYSIFTPAQRAVKAAYAGTSWDSREYARSLERSRELLRVMDRPARKVPRGEYRAFLAPAAVEDLVGMLSWGALSEQSLRKGESALRHLRTGERRFSPLFRLDEDFTSGETPRFNGEGELAPERLTLIENGELKSSLVSSRTAREYGIASNGATPYESLRSPVMAAGTLPDAEALRALGTGLYLSNLHYLNWSDQPEGRITGMTRYACVWVENGQVVAPIESLRWDDSLYRIFGSELEAVTQDRQSLPQVGTYGRRSLGSSVLPGILLRSMRFTL